MNKECLLKKMSNWRGVQKPLGKNINDLDALRKCMSREFSWNLTTKEVWISVIVDVDVAMSSRSVRLYLTTSGREILLAPCLEAAVFQKFVRINFTGTMYCELASTFKSNNGQRGFDKANAFSNRTANPITLHEFRAKGCCLVALYTNDMNSGAPSASNRLLPLKKLQRIRTEAVTGIVEWPDENVVCVEILTE